MDGAATGCDFIQKDETHIVGLFVSFSDDAQGLNNSLLKIDLLLYFALNYFWGHHV